MKALRIFMVALAIAAGCALLLAGAAFNPGLQTWAARRALSGRTGLGGSVGEVSADLDGVRVRGLRLERNGAVLTLPSLDVRLKMLPAALRRRVAVRRLVAKGWTLDLTGVKPAAGDPPPAAAGGILPSANAAPSAPEPAAEASRVFQGIFSRLRLPFHLSLDGVGMEGEVILPPPSDNPRSRPLRVRLELDGGGFAAGREGRLSFEASPASPAAAPMDALALTGTLDAAMDGSDSFTRIEARINAAARVRAPPDGARISAVFSAIRGTLGESYRLALTGGARELMAAAGEFSRGSGRLSGTWRINVCDGDLAPFAFGRQPPLFEVVGGGRFDTEGTLRQTRISGSVTATADRLAAVRPELSAVGAVRLAADFDLMRRGALFRIDHLRASVSNGHPILALQGLQAFAFNADTGELQVADAARDLAGISVQGVPLEWARPFLPGLGLGGAAVGGEFVVSAGKGGLVLRTKSPLSITAFSVAWEGRPLLRAADLRLAASASYTPGGWQVDVDPCTLGDRTASARPGADAGGGPVPSPWLTLSAKCGRLAGQGEAVKVAGRLQAFLPALLAQPAISDVLPGGACPPLVRGRLDCDFTASLAGERSLGARLELANLSFTDPGSGGAPEILLPDVSADARIDFGPGGRASFTLPVVIRSGAGRSDLSASGSVSADGRSVVLDCQVASGRLDADDVRLLVSPFAGISPARAAAPQPASAPAWAGVLGQVRLALKQVDFPGGSLSDITGTLRAEAASLEADGVRLGMKGGGGARVNGAIGFTAGAARPYSLRADLAVDDFDPGPVFRALNPQQEPTVEGKFDLTARLAGEGSGLGDLAGRIRGDCQAASKGGVFRMLSSTVAPKAGKVGRIGEAVAFLDSMTTAVTGRKESGDMANAAQAVSSFARLISPIQYDQLSLVLSRGESLDTVLKDFALIAPEVRLAGNGRVTQEEGVPILGQPLSLDFRLRARGRAADLLRRADALDPKQADDLGYLACTLPIHIGGTLADPDRSGLAASLEKAAAARSGAGKLLGKLLGNR